MYRNFSYTYLLCLLLIFKIHCLSKLSGGVNKPDINAFDKLLSYIKMFPRLFQTISTEEIK